MVIGGDSHSEGGGFKTQCFILDGHFFTLICCKIVLMFVSKRPKINKKEAGDGPFFKKKTSTVAKFCKKYFAHVSSKILNIQKHFSYKILQQAENILET